MWVADPWSAQLESDQPESNPQTDTARFLELMDDVPLDDVPPSDVPMNNAPPPSTLNVLSGAAERLETEEGVLRYEPPPFSSGPNFNKSDMAHINPGRMMGEADINSSRSFDLFRIHSAQLDLLDGDTLVFIDFPTPPSDLRKRVDCHGVAYSSQKFRVHSEKLIATGSSKFADMFNPTYQFRVQRRRKVVNKLPEGVKFVLDLTPPSEGDDLVFQVTELSLTPGIIKWWSSSLLHGVDNVLVGGHDDICPCRMRAPTHQQDDSEAIAQVPADIMQDTEGHKLPPKPETLLQMKARGENQVFETPEERDIPDYSSVRHCNAIIRLLFLIEGWDVPFDSANRVWTMVGISKIFDCTSVVRDKVTQWIMHGANTRFIEVLPEEALQIGTALELPDITQAAFRILVNEMALDEAAKRDEDATDGAPRKAPAQITVFGRKRGDPGDELSNLIQHAATAFVDRISDSIKLFRNPDMFHFATFDQWNKLKLIQQLLNMEDAFVAHDAKLKLSRLLQAIEHKVIHGFEESITRQPIRNTAIYQSMDQDRATYVEPRHFDTLSHLTRGLTETQHMLMPFIYNELGSKWDGPIYNGRYSDHPDTKWHTFNDLVEQLEDSLQKLVPHLPALSQSEAWEPLVEQVPANVFTRSTRGSIKRPIIDLTELDRDVVHMLLRPLTMSWVRHDIEPPLNLTRHMLLTLTTNEMKYLPLWAGGCDDGTGGVFESFVPPTDMGPNGPGPAYHTGFTVPSAPSSSFGSLTEEITAMKIRGSTTAGSVDVNDSISTVYRPDEVIADDRSIPSEAFTTGGSDYQDAQFSVPAAHQPMGQAVDMLVETATDSESQSQTTTDFESVTEEGSQTDGGDERVHSHDGRSEDSMVLI